MTQCCILLTREGGTNPFQGVIGLYVRKRINPTTEPKHFCGSIKRPRPNLTWRESFAPAIQTPVQDLVCQLRKAKRLNLTCNLFYNIARCLKVNYYFLTSQSGPP